MNVTWTSLKYSSKEEKTFITIIVKCGTFFKCSSKKKMVK